MLCRPVVQSRPEHIVARPIGESHGSKKHRASGGGRILSLEFIRVIFDVEDSDESRFVLEIYDPYLF